MVHSIHKDILHKSLIPFTLRVLLKNKYVRAPRPSITPLTYLDRPCGIHMNISIIILVCYMFDDNNSNMNSLW